MPKKMKLLSLIIFTIILNLGFSQNVTKDFDQLLFEENFEISNKKWSNIFNADNLFVIQNGFYELYRKSKKNGYYLIPESQDKYNHFQLETNFNYLEHKNKKQSAGVLMMAQNDGTGGILIEINQKGEFRIVRIYADKLIPISGMEGNNWVKHPAIDKTNNQLIVKTYDKVFDIYINNQYIMSFTEIEIFAGKIGLYIGANSKVKFDNLKIIGESKVEIISTKTEINENASLTDVIIKLKEQINKKNKDIDDLNTRIKILSSQQSNLNTQRSQVDTATQNQLLLFKSKNFTLQEENAELKIKLIELETKVKNLETFKSSVNSSNDGDIVINLTNTVTNQKNKIEQLEIKNKDLNNENNELFIEIKSQTKTINDLNKKLELLNKVNQENDSLKKVILQLKTQKNNSEEKKEEEKEEETLSEEEKLRRMIEKEREERRKKQEEENK